MATEAKLIITAQDATQRAFASVRNSLGAVNGLLGAFGAALSVGAVVAFTRNAIDMAARLDDLAEATGGTVEGLSRLANVAKVSGTDLDTIQRALLELNKAVAGLGGKEAAEGLEAIGLSLKDLQGLSADQRLEAVAQAFNQFEDGTGKSAAALAIFKRQAADVLPFLKDLANDGTTVATVSAEMAARSEEVQKAWNAVALAAERLGLVIGEKLLPVVADLFKAFDNPEDSNIVRGFKRMALEAEIFFTKLFLGAKGVAGLEAELARLMAPKAEPAFQVVKQGRGDVQFKSTEAAATATRKLRDESEKLRQTYRDMLEDWNPLALRWEEDLTQSTELTRELIDQYVLAAEQILGIDAAWQKYQQDMEEAVAGTKELVEATEDQRDIAAEMGAVFTSAFEDAILQGKKFKDILKGIGDDILRLLIRRVILNPIMKIFDEILPAILPSFAKGTSYVERDTMAIVHKGEAIIPAAANLGGAGGPDLTINIENRSSAPITMREQGRSVTPDEIVLSIIAEDARRAGPISTVIRGMR